MKDLKDVFEGIFDKGNKGNVGTNIEMQNVPTSKDIQSSYNAYYVEFAPRFLMDIVNKYDFTVNPRRPQKNFRAIQFILEHSGGYWNLSIRLMIQGSAMVKYITTTDTSLTSVKAGRVTMISYVQRLYENPEILDEILKQEKLYTESLNHDKLVKNAFYRNLKTYME